MNNGSNTVWRLQLVGAVRLQSAAQPQQTVPLTRKDIGWLAYVALNTGVTSLDVATLLWPAADERGALNNLRQRVHRVRKASGARLVEMRETLTLAADLTLEGPASMLALEGDPCAWDAELLAGVRFDAELELSAWLDKVRSAFVERRCNALGQIAAQAERDGELVRALRYAQRLLADEALSEHAHRRLMRLHYLRGDSAAAVAAFDTCESVLKDELGLRPATETQQLLALIERGRAVAAPGQRPRPLPPSLARPPVLIGRTLALQALASAEQSAPVSVLVGEAGIGKTRLLQEWLAARDGGVLAQARPGDAAAPYATLARVVRAVAAHFGPPAGDACQQAALLISADGVVAPSTPHRLQASVDGYLAQAAAQGLRLLAVDDLHFADRASVEMLLALTQSDALPALHWLLAHRPIDAANAESPLLRAFANAPQVRWINVGPLDTAQLHQFVASLGVSEFDADLLAPALARHTGGNPLYAIETLRALLAESGGAAPLLAEGGGAAAGRLPRPSSLAQLIDQRLRGLSKPALALARVAAVAVPDFSIGLAEQVLAAPAIALADAWQELETAQVLRGEAFAHDLVHDGMKRATPEAIAAHLHRLVAAYLARRGTEPARVAHHWWAGGADREAGQAFRCAARLALRATRLREQLALLDLAAAAFDRAGEPAAALLARQDGVTAALNGDGIDSALARVDALLAAADGPLAHSAAWALRANALLFAGRGADAAAAAVQAQQLAPRTAPGLQAEAGFLLAMALSIQGAALDALKAMQPWTAHIDDIEDDHRRMACWGAMCNVLYQADQVEQARQAGERQHQLAERLGDGAEQVSALMSLSTMDLRLGALDQALAAAQQIESLDSASPEGGTLRVWNSTNLAAMLAAQGHYGPAITRLLAARAEFSQSSQHNRLQWLAEHFLAQVWLTLGQPARAHQLVLAEPPGLLGPVRVRRLLLRAAVRHAMGQNGLPLVDEALALCSPQGVVDQRIAATLQRLQYLPADEAGANRCAVLQQQAWAGGFRVLAALAASLRLPQLAAAGRIDELDRAVPEAERLARTCRSHSAYLPALLQHCHGAYLRLGQQDAAARCLHDALDWIHHVALPHVPEEFSQSFLHRNGVNLALRQAAARLSATDC